MFRVFANGIAKVRFHFDKKFADSREVIELTDWLGKLADKAEVPLSTEDFGVRKAGEKLASDIVRSSDAIQSVLQDYCDAGARLTLSYTNHGSLGGVVGAKYHGPAIFEFRDYEIGKAEFYKLLKRMELDYWGYVGGMFVAMDAYALHWHTYGLKRFGANLLMQVIEG